MSNTIGQTKKKKILYLDILRAMACLIVVMFHSKGDYTDDIYGWNFIISNLFEALARIGVPLFVMISGALMLDKEYAFSMKKLVSHIVKLLIFYIVWSFIYALRYVINGSLNLWGFFTNFIVGPYHLWFIPMIIGLYLLLPILRLWVNGSNRRYVEYFLVVSYLFGILIPNVINLAEQFSPAFSAFKSVYDCVHIQPFLGYTGYFILGWYLNSFDVSRKKLLYALGALGVLITSFGTVLLSRFFGEVYSMSNNFRTGVLMYAIAMFIIIRSGFIHVEYSSNIGSRLVAFVCKHSLGIYAVHAMIVPISRGLINFNFAAFQIPVEFLLTLTVSLVVSFVLKKIPLMNKVV